MVEAFWVGCGGYGVGDAANLGDGSAGLAAGIVLGSFWPGCHVRCQSLADCALLRWLTQDWKKTAVVASVLVGLATGLTAPFGERTIAGPGSDNSGCTGSYTGARLALNPIRFSSQMVRFSPMCFPNFSFNVLYLSGDDPANMPYEVFVSERRAGG